jgi:NTE family protein
VSHELEGFLSGIPAFSGLDRQSLASLAEACEVRRYPDRSVILQQGRTSSVLFLLRRGTVAVRVNRGGRRETLAELLPPTFFGELSFVTGRSCSADVEAVGLVDVACLSTEALGRLGGAREALLQVLLQLVATRLHDTVSGRPSLRRAGTVLLRTDDAFPAARAFARAFAGGLQDGAAGNTLLVADGLGGSIDPVPAAGAGVSVAAMPPDGPQFAERLDAWRRDYRHTVLLTPAGRLNGMPLAGIDAVGDLVAGGTPLPPSEAPFRFVAGDAARVRFDVLNGERQLLHDTDAAERAVEGGGALPARFERTARSLARAALGRQVGLALGGGGACCWAHIGLLEVLEDAGIPVDVIAGCSMGSFVGALAGAGRSTADLRQIADSWRSRYARLLELRIWRMHLTNDRRLRRALDEYFAGRDLGSLDTPFWANAVDVLSGEEVIIDRGPVTEAVRASMSLPGSSPAYEYGDRLLVDAAVMAPVPVGPVRAMGADFVIAMNVMPSMRSGSVHRYNPFRFFDILFRSLRLSGHEIGRSRPLSEADILLTPALESYSLLDFPRCDEIIEAGHDVAERHRAQIVAGYRAVVEARA